MKQICFCIFIWVSWKFWFKIDKFKCTSYCCCWPAGSWICCWCCCGHCWFCCCCHWLGAGTPSPLSTILAYLHLYVSIPFVAFLCLWFIFCCFIYHESQLILYFCLFAFTIFSYCRSYYFYFLNNWYPWYQLMIFSQISFFVFEIPFLPFNFKILDNSLVVNLTTSISPSYFWNPRLIFGILGLFLGSQMNLHVMCGSAGLLVLFYLGLSRGIVSHIYLVIIYIECTAIHNAHLWVPL